MMKFDYNIVCKKTPLFQEKVTVIRLVFETFRVALKPSVNNYFEKIKQIKRPKNEYNLRILVRIIHYYYFFISLFVQMEQKKQKENIKKNEETIYRRKKK